MSRDINAAKPFVIHDDTSHYIDGLPSGSPVSPVQDPRHFEQHPQKQHNYSNISPFVFDFDSAQQSPYTRRHPAGSGAGVSGRYRESYRNAQRHQNADWTDSSSTDLDDEHMPEDRTEQQHHRPSHSDDDGEDGEHIALPVELHRAHSMASLRSRRDPHYQGVRTRRARRVIDKTGEHNIEFENIPQRSWLFMKDFVTTLIDCQWRFVISLFAASFFGCWLLFAVLWWLIAHAHGDLDFDAATGARLSDGSVTCVEGASTFAGFLLLSIETQVSIGFGNKYPNEHCPEAVFLMVVQIICGIALEGAMVGIVYAKMSRPAGKSRAREMRFSRRAVVCQRDGRLCLAVRVGDSRSSHAIGTSVQAYWFEERRSAEGERLAQYQYSLKLENDGRTMLLFPTTMCHVIDAQSPLYDLSAKDLLEKRFELIITLTGSSLSTGQMTQSRTSYLPREILWGYRFVNVTAYDRLNRSYQADYGKFDDLVQIDTPLCSARRLTEVLAECAELEALAAAAAASQRGSESDRNAAESSAYGETPSATTLAARAMSSASDSGSVIVMRQQNSENSERVQRRHLERLAEELEYRLSNHSLLMEQMRVEGEEEEADRGVIVVDAERKRNKTEAEHESQA